MQMCSAYLISHTQAVLVNLKFKLNYCISQNDFPIPSVSSVQLLSCVSLQSHHAGCQKSPPKSAPTVGTQGPELRGSEASLIRGFRIQRRRSREDPGAQHPPAPGPSAPRPPSAPADWGRRVAAERQVLGPGLRRPGHPISATTNPQVRLCLGQQRLSRFPHRVTQCVT